MVDGNKRLAWHATIVFLDLNGFTVALSHDAAFNLVLAVAEGSADLAEIELALFTGEFVV